MSSDEPQPLTERYREQLARIYGPAVAEQSIVHQRNGHYFVAVAFEDRPDNVPVTLTREKMAAAVAELARRREW